jgi:hypothetical protein
MLVPSVTRVFSAARDLYVFLQAYPGGATSPGELVAFVSVFRGDVRVFESPPVVVDGTPSSGSNGVPIHLTVPAGTLAPGSYDCQVSVLDPSGERTLFWRAGVVMQ